MSTTEPSAFTLVDLLQRQAERHGDKVAFHFCPEGDDEHDRPESPEIHSPPNDLW